MKISQYNFILKNHLNDSNEEYIAYNARSNALALMNEEQYRQFERFMESGNDIKDQKLFDDLKFGGFIIEDEMDELQILRFKMLKNRYRTDILYLTIAPTSDCNFRCTYCYEKDSVKHPPMSLEIQDALVTFVKKYIKTITALRVTWYGGEPLMCFGIVKRLSDIFIELCDEHGVIYSAGIVTNGYLLTPEICNDFIKCKINSVQITLDGDKSRHDIRRPLRDGRGTFDKIVSNIRAIKGILPYKISLRVNVDKNNSPYTDKIMQLLVDEDIVDVVSPYLAMVKSSNGCCSNELCFSSDSFAPIYYNFEMSKEDRNIMRVYPMLKSNFCGADLINSFVVDADGNLYKCWDDLGIHKRSIGCLQVKKQGSTYCWGIQEGYMLYDPTIDDMCKTCKVLPVCMGGCPASRLQSSDRCNYIKTYIEKFLLDAVDNLKSKK